MVNQENKLLVLDFMERSFNQGDLSAIDEHLAADSIDHQEPTDTNFAAHLKQVIKMLRTAFPDLHFEIHDILAEGEIVAFRSTMTGTHRGHFQNISPTGKKISVAHMHFVRIVDGKNADLWHLWDMPDLMRQLGAAPEQHRQPA